MPARSNSAAAKNSAANIGFEAKLWLAADKLRNHMDAAKYKHVVIGLIFLKCISDTFEEHRAKLLAGEGAYVGATLATLRDTLLPKLMIGELSVPETEGEVLA